MTTKSTRMIVVIFLQTLLLTGFTQAQTVQNVDAVRFMELTKQKDILLLDVRTEGEYSRGHIKGSTLIDLSSPSAANRLGLLQKNKTILIYCLSGSRSTVVAQYMQKQGFGKIYNLTYGLMDWNQKGYPLEQSNQPMASSGTSYTTQTFNKLLADNKLVLVDFHAVWCAPCKAMNPVIEKITTDFKGKARVEKVDVELNKAITAAWQVQSVPGFVLFKAGQKVWSHTGTISYDELSGVIKKFM